MAKPVTGRRIAIGALRVQNATAAAHACRKAGIPYFVALALLEKESGGRNIYGHDKGGVNTIKGDMPVTERNFLLFLVRVMNGETSNGVGPLQITYAGELKKGGHRDGGYFRQMAEQNLCPWIPEDNMLFGFKILAEHYKATGSWEAAGARYNGGSRPNATALAYGRDLADKASAWKVRLGV